MSSRNEMSGLKRLVLGGAVAGLSTLSGCVPLAIASAAHYVAEHDAAVIQANATRDAAGVQSGNNNRYSNASYNDNSSQVIEFFKVYLFNEWVDVNNSSEMRDMKGLKDIFVKGENITSVIWLGKRYPEAQLRLFDSNGKKITEAEKIYNTQGFRTEGIQNINSFEKLSEGTYDIVIDCQGKVLGQREFRVVSN